MARLKTPWARYRPSIPPADFERMKASIKTGGVRDPIWTDPDGNIMDGHSRYKIDPKAPSRVLPGSESMTEAEKIAWIIRESERQNREASLGNLKETALRLKQEGKTQAEIGRMLNRTQQAIGKMLKTSNTTGCNAESAPPDNRRKLTDSQRAEAVQMVADGQTQAAVAEHFGVSPAAISNLVRASRKTEASNGKLVGKITKHDPLSLRITAAKAEVADGLKVNDACARYALARQDYSRGKIVVEREHPRLLAALDSGLVTVAAARRLVPKTDSEINEELHKREEKQSAKRGQAKSTARIPTAQKVENLLAQTLDIWTAFKQNVKLKKKSIGRQHVDGLQAKCKAVRKVTAEVLSKIEGIL